MQPQPVSVRVRMTVDFMDAVKGVKKTVQVPGLGDAGGSKRLEVDIPAGTRPHLCCGLRLLFHSCHGEACEGLQDVVCTTLWQLALFMQRQELDVTPNYVRAAQRPGAVSGRSLNARSVARCSTLDPGSTLNHDQNPQSVLNLCELTLL